jgi:hypothetical protein
MGAQRKGSYGGCGGRFPCGRKVNVLYEACRRKCGGRPPVYLSYTGVNGGMVLVCADDPECTVPRTNRIQGIRSFRPCTHAGAFGQSGSAGFYDKGVRNFRKIRYARNAPSTTRVAHSRSMVETGEPVMRN